MTDGILARAPSNIALIKYMGKVDAIANLPTNGSLSLTLNRLCTVVQIVPRSQGFEFESQMPAAMPAELKSAAAVPQLDSKGVSRILSHVQRVIDHSQKTFATFKLPYQKITGAVLRSANTFPAQTGIASSASSFAATTLAVAAASCPESATFAETLRRPEFRQALAQISRQGSGSSCRSFEGPYVQWQGAVATPVVSKLPALVDLVCIVSRKNKKVGSSEAHARVSTSPLWKERVQRVEARMKVLRQAVEVGDYSAVAQYAWQEAWEMHSLFHTAEPPFSYFEGLTMEMLQWLDALPQRPIVTLDAGPNVHLLVKQSEADHWQQKVMSQFKSLEILRDEQGRGAELIDFS